MTRRHVELHPTLLPEEKLLDRSHHTTPATGSERSLGIASHPCDHYITALPDLSLPQGANTLYPPQDIHPHPDTTTDKSRPVFGRATTLRPKNSWSIVGSKQTESKDAVPEVPRMDISLAPEKTTSCMRATDWMKRAANSTFGRKRRKSVATVSTFHGKCADMSTISQMPSRPSVHRSSGAAARAAAAAQNELLGSTRNLETASKDSTLVEPTIARDSESGIGIDLRDREEDIALIDVPISRLGQWIVLIVLQ